MPVSFSEISVVILNWNGLHFLKQFLPSVIQHSGDAVILVADNGSTDDSVHWLATNYPQVKQIKNGANLGFCAGYNRAMEEINTPFAVLLNSDVEVSPNWLAPLLNCMKQNPLMGACQPTLLSFHHRNQFEYAGAAGGFIDPFGYPFCRGRIFNSVEENTGQYPTITPVFWASGACMFIKTGLFKALGGFDENLFAHMEEIDLCWRMQHKGYTIAHCPESVVYHVGGGTLHKSNPKKTYLNFRNSLYVLHKNTASQHLTWLILRRLLLDGLAGVYFLLYGHPRDTLAVLKAHFSYYRFIPHLNTIRKTNPPKPNDLIYKHSIVCAHYLRKKNRYTEL